jgi:malic enzyme
MYFSIKVDPRTWQVYMAVRQKGKALLIDPFINKGTAFTTRERDELDLHGLLPPAVCSMHQQLERAYENFQGKANDLEKFIYLTSLNDRNETLFYRLVYEHIDEMVPIVYTPTVGEACQKFSHIYRRARGLYISYDQRHNIEKILGNFYMENACVIVVTDGERILGLGDQGAGGMAIPIGKLCLYTLCAGMSPYHTLPIMLDAGTDNEERLQDPLYLGLRQERIRGEEYQRFIDAFVTGVHKVFPHVLLQWEDFLKGNAIKQWLRFENYLCTFNDDIQGTAGAVLAGIYSALRITGKPLREVRILIAGAGAAAYGIATLIVSALQEKGTTQREAQKHIWIVDSGGLITKTRANFEDFMAAFARDTEEIGTYKCADPTRITLEEVITNAETNILVGVSTAPGIFDQSVVQAMAAVNERPVILPLSNPTSNSECTPEDALRWSEGRAIVSTGSPFSPVKYNGRTYRIGQCNNAFIFPGIGLSVTVGRIQHMTSGMFLAAAEALAEQVTTRDFEEGALYPELGRIRECSHAVACAVIREAVKEGHAHEDTLINLEQTVRKAMWYPEYLPVHYEP